jgi:alpha-beta hydrolase superfamily lysophospholipase
VQQTLFTIALTLISKAFLLRDYLTGRIGQPRPTHPNIAATDHKISSRENRLQAVFVGPIQAEPKAALLICHGIGETTERWFDVQQLLAINGVESLVFDYSGYGKSTGTITASQCEQDAIAAFRYLQTLTSAPSSILGFSMGSGIAAAIIDNVPTRKLILCAAFTSFKDGALSIGFPRILSGLVPDIWRTRQILPACPLPILIVHGAQDQLFPATMATDLLKACKSNSQLILVPGLAHDDPYYRPDIAYWSNIIAFLRNP